MLNALAIYIEEWYHRNDIEVPDNIKHQTDGAILKDTRKILEILNRYKTQATFFVLGCIAERYPFLVREIHNCGHEIASHGYEHNLIYGETSQEFKADLAKSIQILQDITNQKILGYSAPSWSITEDSYWAIDILRGQGILYDSSIFPVRTFLYGIPNSPRFPYKIAEDGIVEIPPSTIRLFWKNIPFSGGFFFRIMPYWFIKRCLKKINEKENKPVLVYLHSWELNPNQPRLKLSIKKRIIPYVNLNYTEEKLYSLLNCFKFAPIRDIILTRSL